MPSVPEATGHAEPRGASRWTQLFGDAATYTVGDILNRLFPFLLLPVLTRYLTPAEYGTFVMFQVVVNFLLPLVGLNVEAAVSRAMVQLSAVELSLYISTALISGGGVALGLVATAAALAGPLQAFLGVPGPWLLIAIVVATGESAKAVLLTVWQMEHRSRTYASFTVTQTAARTVACLAPVVWSGGGAKLEGLLWGYSLSLLAFAVYAVIELVRCGLLVPRWAGEPARAFLRYGLPLVPHRVSGWLTGMADRVIIAKLTSLGQVGIYSVGYSIGTAVALVQEAFNRAWVPFFFDRLARGDAAARVSIVQFICLYAIAMLATAVAVTAAAPLVFPLLGPRFAAARVFVVWISFAYALNGIYKMFANFLFYSARTSVLSAITISTGVVTLGVTILLVASRGVIGAAYGAVIGQALACAAVFVAARSVAPMPWRTGLATLPERIRRWRAL